MKLDEIGIWSEIKLEIKEPSVSYKTVENRCSLVSEIWAIRGKCDALRAEKIAKRANLPLKWFVL